MIPGATSSTFAAPTGVAGTTYYFCVVTNTDSSATGNNTATSTSNVVGVTVNSLIDAELPTLDTQPTGQTVNQGGINPNLTVAASVNDGGTLSYQWFSNSLNSTNGGTAINRATSPTYSVPTDTAGTKFYYVVVTNSNNNASGSKTATSTSNAVGVTVLSGNADLNDLTLSEGTLDHEFTPGRTNYTAKVGNAVTSVEVTAVVADSTASLWLSGSSVGSGQPKTVALNVGDNEIDIIVTSQSGSTKHYTLTVNRRQVIIPSPPSTGGGSNQGIVEDQLDLNKRVSGTITSAKDGLSVLDAVDKVLEHLNLVTESNSVPTEEKLKVISNTVSEVLGPMMDKEDEGLVSGDDIVKITMELLSKHVDQVMEDMSDSSDGLHQGTEILGDIASTVIAKLDKRDLDDKFKEKYSALVNRLIDKSSNVDVESRDMITDLEDQMEQFDKLVTTIVHNLGETADQFSFNKRIVLTILDEQKEISVKSATDTGSVHLSKEVVNQLVKKQIILVVRDEQQNSMELTEDLLAKLKNKKVSLSVEESKSVPVPSSFGSHSKAYEFNILADNKAFTQFGKSVVHVTIATKAKSRDLFAYYYDVKKKSWKQLTDSRGKTITVNRSTNGFASFDTSHFTTFMVAEAPIRSLSVTPKTVKLMTNSAIDLSVVATFSNGKKVDVTSEEAGTVYESSNSKSIKVSDNGIITATEAAEAGDKASITVSNGNKNVTVKVTVVTLSSISASANKRTVFAGDKIAVKVKGLLSDRSSLDLTKDKGTSFTLEDDEYDSINKDGLLVISKQAPKGTSIKVMIQNDDHATELEITVK